MAGYTRQSTFADGDTITAALFNNEYNQLLNAFSNTGGHKHDGTATEGPVIGLIGDAGETSPNNKVLIDTTNNFIEFYVQVSSSSVQQLYIADGAIVPVTDSDIDLGTTSLRFKDTYTDTITTTGNVAVGGNLTVTGTTTFNGGTITMGDAATDNVVFGADVNSNIIPNTDSAFDLGSSTQEWRDLYLDGTAHIDTLDVDVNATIAGTLGVTGVLTGTSLDISGDIDVDGTTNLDVVDIDGAVDMATTLAVAGNVDFNGDLDVDGTTNLDVVDIDGAVDMASTLQVDGVATFTSRDIHNGGITIANAGQIGSVGDTDAIAIASDGVVTLTQKLVGTELDISGNVDVDGTTNLDVVDIDGAVDMATTLTVAGNVDFNGDLDVDGTTNLDVVDIDGAVDMATTLTVGGEITAASLDISGNVDIDGTLETDALSINSTAVTSTAAEINILDGVTSTAAELNILDGVTSTAAELNLLDGVTSTTAELNILDGVTASATDINLIDGITNGTVIASKAIITDANKDITGGRNITISGELDAATLDISGDADIDGTLEADAITIGGITLAETISDTVGAMVTSNTESGITVAYDDTDNTLDFTVGTLNQDTTGLAATATALATARTIHGVSFDGTANIDLTEVVQDTVGAMVSSNTESNITVTYEDSDGTLDFTVATLNQDTTGNAATATALETARTIHGISFDGTANIDLSEVIQDTVGAMVSSNTESGITVTYQDGDGTLDFSVASTDSTQIVDADSDTKIQVEESSDEDKIRFDTGGTERAVIDSSGLTVTSGTINGVGISSNITNFSNSILISGDAGTGTLSGASNNTGLGFRVFEDLTSGTNNVALGRVALANLTSGTQNVALGNDTLFTNTTGGSNVAIGQDALNANTTASNNTAVGKSALAVNTTGRQNVAVGSTSLDANTTGENNTAIGHDALSANTTADENTALGAFALNANTTGAANTALGLYALINNTTASNNTAAGRSALQNNTTGTQNVAVGAISLDANTTGNYNSAFGYAALSNATTGDNNTGLGRNALGDNTTASNNTAVGYNSMAATTTGGDNTAVGRNALDANTTGTNNVAIGESALSTATTASGNTAIGKDALAIATGGENTVVGKKAGDAIQAHVRNTIMGDTAGSAVNSSDNTFIGQNSGSAITSGDANTILGRYSGNEGGLDIRSSSNNIVLSDGDGNPRAFFNSSGNMGLGLTNGDASNAQLVVAAQVASGDLPVLDFDGYGNRGDGASQSINFRMGRTGQATDQGAQIRSIFQGGGATAGQTSIGFEFRPISSDVVATTVRFSGTGQRIQFWSDELPHSNNPITNQAFVIGPSSSGAITSGLTTSTVLQNRSGELYAVDSSHNNTQITPHNWGLISSGPSEELAWTYYSQRPNPSNNDQLQTINVDMAKVIRKVEDLVGEKLIYTENSDKDGHTFQTIISDIQTSLTNLTTRIEALEA